jgi:hypothetical protein
MSITQSLLFAVHLSSAAALLFAMPAQAQVFAVATSGDGARVVLHDKTGPCVGAARLAEHIAPNGEKVPGCWLLANDTVKVSFLDGERGSIPVAHLKKAETL